MNVSLILKLLPWNLVYDVVMSVIEMVIEDSENEHDDKLFEVVENVLNKASSEHPDDD